MSDTRTQQTKGESHELYDFMADATRQMESDYYRIEKRVCEDPGTAGDQGEENWASLLRDWLPRSYEVVTKGRILSYKGIAGPQIDVLVLHPTYPRSLIHNKLYLAGGVAAAFECKLTLRTEHIKKAVSNAVKIREYLPQREGSPYLELHSPLIYGVLAHSHEWQAPQSTPIPNIIRRLSQADRQYVTHPSQMLDMLCVADLASWVAARVSWIRPAAIPVEAASIPFYPADGCATTAYMCHPIPADDTAKPFTPIGTMISALLQRLAWENLDLRRIATYFADVGLGGQSSAQMRPWDSYIYSEKIREDVTSLRRMVLDRSWNEWRMIFT